MQLSDDDQSPEVDSPSPKDKDIDPKLTSLLFDFILSSYSPFRLIENKYLVEILKQGFPRYKPSSRRYFASKLLDEQYSKLIKKIKNEISEIKKN